MMALMRKMIHNNVYKIFLWIFLFMMAAGSGISFFNMGKKQDWVIKVYNHSMNNQKFQSMLKTAKQQQEMYRQKGFVFANQNISKETIVNASTSLLLNHLAETMGIRVSSDFINTEVKRQLQQLPAHFFKENGDLNYDIFAQLIAPFTIEEFLSEIELEAIGKVTYGLIDASVYNCDFEVALAYDNEYASKSYSYIIFPFQKYLASAKANTVSKNELAKFYKKPSIQDQFKTTEQRSGVLWTFNPAHYVTSVSDSEIKSLYDKNKATRYLLEPAQIQIRSLLIAIEPGKESEAKTRALQLRQDLETDPGQFETMVRKFSDDKVSAAHAGLSGFFKKDDPKINKIVSDTAFEFLLQDGQISAPIKTDRGYELIQRVAKQVAKYKDLKSVQTEISKEIVAEKFKKRFAQDAGRVINSAKYEPGLLEKFIERYKGVRSELPFDSRKAGLNLTYLFKTEQGRHATYFDKDLGVILLCDKIEKSYLPDLDEVSAKVTALYYENKALEAMKKDLSQAFKRAHETDFAQVAQSYNLSVSKAASTLKDGKLEQSPLLKEQEVSGKIKSMHYQGALAAVETKTDGILFQLDTISPRNQTHFDEQKNYLAKTAFYMKKYQNKEGFIASLYRTAKLNNKIEIKPELLSLTKEV